MLDNTVGTSGGNNNIYGIDCQQSPELARGPKKIYMMGFQTGIQEACGPNP